MVWPEEAGTRCGAGEAGESCLASEASGVRPGEHELSGEQRADARLVEQLGGELGGELFDLAGELSFFSRELLDASSDGFEGELAAAELGVLSAVGSSGAQACQQAGPAERTQLAAERLGCRDEQVA